MARLPSALPHPDSPPPILAPPILAPQTLALEVQRLSTLALEVQPPLTLSTRALLLAVSRDFCLYPLRCTLLSFLRRELLLFFFEQGQNPPPFGIASLFL